jgi:hypothetical protein
MHQPVVSHGRACKQKSERIADTSRTDIFSNPDKLTARIADNVHHRYELSISTGVAAVRTEFAWSKSRHESSGAAATLRSAFGSAVAICGIGCNELVWVAAEVYAGLADEIQEGEFVVFCFCFTVSRVSVMEVECSCRFVDAPPGTPKTVSMPSCLRRVKR